MYCIQNKQPKSWGGVLVMFDFLTWTWPLHIYIYINKEICYRVVGLILRLILKRSLPDICDFP